MSATASSSVPVLKKFYLTIRSIGDAPSLDDYERRKLALFSILNCMGIFNGIVIPVAGLFNNDNLPALAWVAAISPAVISSISLYLLHRKKYEWAKLVYFTCYPMVTAMAYLTNIDLGIELFFFVYGMLAVFMFEKLWMAMCSFGFSIALYMFVYVFLSEQYTSKLAVFNPAFFLFNHLLATVFIFLSLTIFKRENLSVFAQLRARNEELQLKNREIEQQARDLKELDNIKNKLFSVISHDLKTPMYALRNLFRSIQQYDVPGDEIKLMIPDVVTDLNYTTGLMENLLQWAKSQMQSAEAHPQPVDLSALIKDVLHLLHLQMETKKVYVENKINAPVYVYADKDMVNLVLRNLVSNAIKFTGETGTVYIDANEVDAYVEVLVEDTGVGIDAEALEKINQSNYYTTKGTANESGTGLGLMLCKEFLARNGGKMYVESEPGKGSTFSFTLPRLN